METILRFSYQDMPRKKKKRYKKAHNLEQFANKLREFSNACILFSKESQPITMEFIECGATKAKQPLPPQ